LVILKNRDGFTLLELLVSIGILVILLAIAIPNYGAMRARARLRGATLRLYGDINYAKINAIKTGVHNTILFNQSIGGSTYNYVIFMDQDSDTTYDSWERIVKRVNYSGTEYQGVTISANPIRFNSQGLLATGAQTITLTENSQNITQNITVNMLGRVNIQ